MSHVRPVHGSVCGTAIQHALSMLPPPPPALPIAQGASLAATHSVTEPMCRLCGCTCSCVAPSHQHGAGASNGRCGGECACWRAGAAIMAITIIILATRRCAHAGYSFCHSGALHLHEPVAASRSQSQRLNWHRIRTAGARMHGLYCNVHTAAHILLHLTADAPASDTAHTHGIVAQPPAPPLWPPAAQAAQQQLAEEEEEGEEGAGAGTAGMAALAAPASAAAAASFI